MNMLKATFSFLLGTSFITYSQAECPNACSMQGTCGPRDQCTCYKHYQGNDCSERICPFGNAHVDVPKGDLNMDGEHKFDDDMKYHQVYPNEVSELWNSGGEGSKGHAGEAHYYMECSARGLCDRSSGTCTCFDGYEGVSCQRLSCPNSCSGHGTCESVKELSSKATGTDLTFKPLVSAKSSYDLWDARYYYGCKCDPSYFGHDCSQRRCPVGVDPMYEAGGEEQLETVKFSFNWEVRTSGELISVATNFRVRFFDYWGDSYLTDKIYYGSDDDVTASNIKRALEALPNQVIDDVKCYKYDDAGAFAFSDDFGPAVDTKRDAVYCQFTTNPGVLRFPELVNVKMYYDTSRDSTSTDNAVTLDADDNIYLVPTVLKGENVDAAAVADQTAFTMTAIAKAEATLVQATSGNHGLTGVKLIKIGAYYHVVTFGSTTVITFANAPPALIAAGTKVKLSAATVTPSDTDPRKIATWAFGLKTFTTVDGTADCNLHFNVGTVHFIHNVLYTVTSCSTNQVTVDRPFAGIATNNDVAGNTNIGSSTVTYRITWPTTGTYEYVNECSNRGLCNRDSGLCECFTGYHTANCDTQSHIAG